MIIQKGLVFGKDGKFERADVRVKDGIVQQVGEIRDLRGEAEILDAAGKYVVPGFVDIHLHGAAGHDFCDGKEASLEKIAGYERSRGVTSICPTTMSLPMEELQDILRRIDESAGKLSNRGCARILGIHLEGPFLAPGRRGAQKEACLRDPDPQWFRQLQRASGNRIRLVTLAPELSGGMEFIRQVKSEAAPGEKLTVSLGHSQADYETAAEAFRAGADHVTHLWNAMPGMHHRQPGIAGAAMDQSHVTAELICDGLHIHPAMVRAAFRLFGPDRICLVSDSMEAAGMPDGEYSLGGQRVYKKDGAARLSDGTLAGSVTDLFACFQRAVRFGVPLEDALKAVTCNPARSIGMEGRAGVIRPGAPADILLLNAELELERVL